jgi:peptidoglycan/xylan/chitin deacetylase (PgdA/CDA1 family)
MFFDYDIRADRLPFRTLCLTYDDGPGESDGEGPGPHTWELGRYLHAEGIRAAFFVIGQHVERYPETVAALREWGHLIGNHTYTHPDLVDLAGSGGDVVGEVARTDAALSDQPTDETVFFRPPYGRWRQPVSPDGDLQRPDSIVAATLNGCGRFARHVGPVGWDIVADDWNCWRYRVPVEACARWHLRRIESAGRGVVLLHDSSEDTILRRRNQALSLTRRIVPELKWKEYRFIRLDEIPQVRTAAMVRAQAVLSTPDGRPLHLGRGDPDAIVAGPRDAGPREPFGLVPFDGQRFAIRARNGLFLAARNGQPSVLARSLALGLAETFEVEPLGSGEFAFRSADGIYLCLSENGDTARLTASTRRADRGRFRFEALHTEGRSILPDESRGA